ncbi:MAG: DUF4124 domain-containing protein [Azoarcus sp.]|nr:DUF4124 domain-containing protein [Azoarcus sp.]
MKPKCAAIYSSLFFLMLAPLPASAQIFKCVDANGKVTYSNEGSSSKGCKPMSNEQSISTISMRPSSSSSTFPRVSDDAQRERDRARRQVLERELADEQSKLEEVRNELAEQEAVFQDGESFVVRNAKGDVVRRGVNPQKKLDRLQPYQDAVMQHERNIEALNQELSRLR